MPALEMIPFGGRRAREQDHLIPLEAALIATDCILDEDTLKGRPAYRDALGSAIGSPGDQVQGLWRFRPSASSARTVVALGGKVYVVTDPSSETASDAVATLLGSGAVFGATANISGAQLGANFYLATDEKDVNWQRIVWTESGDVYSLETIKALPKGDKPTLLSQVSPSWAIFRTTTGYTLTDSAGVTHSNATLNTTWVNVTASEPTVDRYIDVTFTKQDWSYGQWLLVGVTPHDGGNTIISIQVGNADGALQEIGQIYDTPQAAGSEDIIFCDILGLMNAIKIAVTKIRFQWLRPNNDYKFGIYGFAVLPPVATLNPQRYYTTFFDPSTGQESPLTDVLEVTVDSGVISLTYQDYWMDKDNFVNGAPNADPFSFNNLRIFNRGAGKAFPGKLEIGTIVTLRQALKSVIVAGQVVRLWKDMENGRRLVKAVTLTSAHITAGFVDIVDVGNLNTLSAQGYKATGAPPRANALGSHASRLVAGYLNKVSISSFTPGSLTTNPTPQFPDLALEEADGWSFDIAPGTDEQVAGIDGHGDSVYILTNLAVHTLSDLRPNSLPYLVFRRGCTSRRGYVYAEDRLFWDAWDGLYEAVNRSETRELSLPIRRLYKDAFLPDANVVLSYDIASRSLIVLRDNKELRYGFAAERGREWTGLHTLGDTIRHLVSWIDPGSATPQFWMLTTGRRIGRLQASATRDMEIGVDETTGAAIPDWGYSTGFALTPGPSVIKGLLVDADGPVRVTLAKTVEGIIPVEARLLEAVPKDEQDEVWIPGAADFRAQKFRFQFDASNRVSVRRALFERVLIESKGG